MAFFLISLPIIVILLIFNFRRILFSLVILFPRRWFAPASTQAVSDTDLPDVLVLSSCRDEEEVVLTLCQAIDRIDYPLEKLQVVLIDDGSTDKTAVLMERFAAVRPGWHIVKLGQNLGKAAALNEALQLYSFGEIIFVFDADHQPKPDVVRLGINSFQDKRVGGVSGRTVPFNPLCSLTAYYSTVEGYVHQMVTMRAKDRLNLAPAMLGSNCAYRRSALLECGGFRLGVLLEDTDLTLAYYLSGYKVRFIEEMISYHHVPETIKGYMHQHMRWARGFSDVAKYHGWSLFLNRSIAFPLRLELFLFSTGYLDRLALVAGALLVAVTLAVQHPAWLLAALLVFAGLTPAVQILLLFLEQGVSWDMWVRVPLIPFFFSLDIFTAAAAAFGSLVYKKPVWLKTPRARTAFPVDQIQIENNEPVEQEA